MSTITISGYSDDLIEVDGDFREEYTAGSGDEGWVVLASGGVVYVCFDEDGRWRTKIVRDDPGVTVVEHYVAPPEDPEDRDYTDKLTISGGNLLPVEYVDNGDRFGECRGCGVLCGPYPAGDRSVVMCVGCGAAG